MRVFRLFDWLCYEIYKWCLDHQSYQPWPWTTKVMPLIVDVANLKSWIFEYFNFIMFVDFVIFIYIFSLCVIYLNIVSLCTNLSFSLLVVLNLWLYLMYSNLRMTIGPRLDGYPQKISTMSSDITRKFKWVWIRVRVLYCPALQPVYTYLYNMINNLFILVYN